MPRRLRGRSRGTGPVPAFTFTAATPPQYLSDSETDAPPTTGFENAEALRTHLGELFSVDVASRTRPNKDSLYRAVYDALPAAIKPRFVNARALRQAIVSSALEPANRSRIANHLFQGKDTVSTAELNRFLDTLGSDGDFSGEDRDLVLQLIASRLDSSIIVTQDGTSRTFDPPSGIAVEGNDIQLRLDGEGRRYSAVPPTA